MNLAGTPGLPHRGLLKMAQESYPRPGSMELRVNDEILNLKLLSASVASMGYRFIGARDGAGCLKVLKKANPPRCVEKAPAPLDGEIIAQLGQPNRLHFGATLATNWPLVKVARLKACPTIEFTTIFAPVPAIQVRTAGRLK